MATGPIRVETSAATILLTEAPEPKVRDRQTGRPADRQTGRPADRQTGRPAISITMDVCTHVVQDTQREAVSHMDRLLRMRRPERG